MSDQPLTKHETVILFKAAKGEQFDTLDITLYAPPRDAMHIAEAILRTGKAYDRYSGPTRVTGIISVRTRDHTSTAWRQIDWIPA